MPYGPIEDLENYDFSDDDYYISDYYYDCLITELDIKDVKFVKKLIEDHGKEILDCYFDPYNTSYHPIYHAYGSGLIELVNIIHKLYGQSVPINPNDCLAHAIKSGNDDVVKECKKRYDI